LFPATDSQLQKEDQAILTKDHKVVPQVEETTTNLMEVVVLVVAAETTDDAIADESHRQTQHLLTA
jgi:hypothetical protein